MTATTIEAYADGLFGSEDALMTEIRDEALKAGIPAIQVPWELGRLLQFLVLARGARRILEIGTLFGYSTILMARAMPDGRIITLEADPVHARAAQRNFDRAGVMRRVEIRLGPAVETLPTMIDECFDLVFIDADKQSYPQYLDWSLRLTRSGSIIVADNVWRGGSVVDPAPDDTASQGAADFARKLAGDGRLHTTVISTRDGADATSVSIVR